MLKDSHNFNLIINCSYRITCSLYSVDECF